MKRITKLPLAYKLPAIIVILGALTAAASAVLVVRDLHDNLVDPDAVRLLHEISLPVLLSSAVLAVVGFFLARGITGPLSKVGAAMAQVARRDYAGEIPATGRGDEIGSIANSLAGLRDDLAERETAVADLAAIIAAIADAQSVIEFDSSGKILKANRNLLDAMGYAEAEIIGRPHATLLAPEQAETAEYRRMWESLRSGEAVAGTFKRLAKGGRVVYLQGAYSPVRDASGVVVRVVKVASDVTKAETERLKLVTEASSQLAIINAIRKARGMIAFDPKGKILDANQIFLDMVDYSEAEIIGRPHAMFVEPGYANSDEYRRMWDSLAGGQAIPGTFPSLAKGGRVVYLGGAYYPLCDESGACMRVLLLASDFTKPETERLTLERSARDQAAIIDAISGGLQGMIEFDVKGKVLRANSTFLETMGYTEAEAVGQPHATFVEPEFAASSDYRRMWERLGGGEAIRGTFKRLAKGGRVVYLDGTYSPVRDASGTVTRVVKVASDVTKAETERLESIERRAAMEAEQARVVEQLSAALSELADGDLAIRLLETFAPEYESLRGNFNDAIEKLENALSAVMLAAENIRNESTQVTQAADELSHRTENQAAALEETAAALEELTSSVKTAAKSAEKASSDVGTTRQNAEESGRIVREAVSAMSEIEKSSGHISQIIGVIDDIAFQTNLLALNAGVEAARAGEAGRGFAVVASEVRALAQRSSDAAKEIKALISTSSQQVGHGVHLVRETGKSLATIVEAVGGIAALVGEIANSAREQSVGLTEINTAVTQLDQVTQQNAAMVEESTAASHAMKAEAESLASLVAQFNARVSETATPARASKVSARTASGTAVKPVSRTPATKPNAKPSAMSAPRTNGSAALAIGPRDPFEDWKDF